MKIIRGEKKIALILSQTELFLIRAAVGNSNDTTRKSQVMSRHPKAYEKLRISEYYDGARQLYDPLSDLCDEIEKEL